MELKSMKQDENESVEVVHYEKIQKLVHGLCRNPTLAKCGGEANTWKSWGFRVLRDS
jgi:hypothetical protein